MIFRAVAALAFASVAFDATAISIRLTHPYGELIDHGVVTAEVAASSPQGIDCTIPPDLHRVGNTITIVARRLATPTQACLPPLKVPLGELSAGWWQISLHIVDVQPPALIESVTAEWRVQSPDTLCSPYGVSSLIVQHPRMDGSLLANRIASDPAYAALLGSPIGLQALSFDVVLHYQPLDNPYDVRARLQATGEFANVWVNEPACFATPPPDRVERVVEYYHARLDHYFYTAHAHELAALDNGTVAQGWVRTGKSFRVLFQPGCALYRTERVAYRFFGKPGVGPSSHVFTVDRAECKIVDTSKAWIYEGIAFWATPANSAGSCSNAAEQPVYRVWRPFGESNHRFTIERAVVDEMKAKGWIEEGAVMCVPR